MKKNPMLNQTPFSGETSPQKPFNRQVPVWLIMAVIIIVLVIAGFLIFKQYLVSKPPAQPTSQGKELPAAVHSYVGEVVKISNDRFVIQANAAKNNLLQNALLTVKFDANTKFTNQIIAKKLTGDPKQDQTKIEPAAVKDLKNGSQVVVTSSQNIRNKNLFTASTVQIQTVK